MAHGKSYLRLAVTNSYRQTPMFFLTKKYSKCSYLMTSLSTMSSSHQVIHEDVRFRRGGSMAFHDVSIPHLHLRLRGVLGIDGTWRQLQLTDFYSFP